MKGRGCFLFSINGGFYHSVDDDDIDGHSEPFGKEGTIIAMTLNMDKMSVCYKINDKDYGYVNRNCVDNKSKYRLAVTMEVTKCEELELL